MAFLSHASHLGSLLLPHDAFQEHATHRAEWGLIFFLMQPITHWCMINKYFFRLPDQGLIRQDQPPREEIFTG